MQRDGHVADLLEGREASFEPPGGWRRRRGKAARAEARDWTVCAVFRDPGVIKHDLILGHIWWRMEWKENPGSYQRDLQC